MLDLIEEVAIKSYYRAQEILEQIKKGSIVVEEV